MVFPFRYVREGEVKRTPKAQPSIGMWGHAPPEIFIFGASEIPFPIFCRGKFHTLKHEKTLTILYTSLL